VGPSGSRVVAVLDPSLVAPGSTEKRLSTPKAAASRRRRIRLLAVGVGAGLLAFLAIHTALTAYQVHVYQAEIRRSLAEGYLHEATSLGHEFGDPLLASGILYIAFAVAGLALAIRGRRFLFAAPAAVYVLLPALTASHGAHPQPIGRGWLADSCFMGSCHRWFFHPWLGPLVDLALVLLPGAIALIRRPRHRGLDRVGVPEVAAIAVVAFAVATAIRTTGIVQRPVTTATAAAVVTFGFALGTARPWWPWLHSLFAAAVSGFIAATLGSFLFPWPGDSFGEFLPWYLSDTAPYVAVGLLASFWQPLAVATRWLAERPRRLVVAVNALNLADAVMTALAVRSGAALEMNPVVRTFGLPLKVLLVGVLTGMLYRRRPSTLIWPMAVLLGVLCYQISGIVINR
jgi:hypothetical protein